jgi:hypothetical protein
MGKKVIFQAAAIASIVAFIGVIGQVWVMSSVPTKNVQLQPSFPGPVEEFVQGTNTYPRNSLAFFASDSLFVLGYVLVFVGLYCVTSDRARPFALIGLGAGIFTALMDASENAFFITYAMNSIAGIPLTTPDLPLIYILANLKWMAAFVTLFAFGLVFPRHSVLEWLITILMFLFPVVGILGIALPDLIALRGLFFLLGMPLFAFYFVQQSRRVVVN